jgi:hypothetical protein
MIEKSIRTIFWNITEPEYRKDPALSQSTLATFERKGFSCLDTLFEHEESPSLTFGSAVDCIITDGEKAFADRFFISDVPKISATAEPIVREIYNQFHNSYTNINDIPESELMPILSQYGYKGNTKWGSKAKCDAIRTDGAQYYQTMFMAGNKTTLSQDTYNKVFACVRALKDSPQTKAYFKEDDPFDDVERVYQMKFKGVLGGITYRGMSDLLVVDHKNKRVIPCDLKTSSGREYEFPEHFLQWNYQIQARLYWRLIRQTMDKDDYFKDFMLVDFRFIVVNNIDNPTPVVWLFPKTQAVGTVVIVGKKLRDPEVIGKELTYYLDHHPSVPLGIALDKPNNIERWFDDKQ